MKRLVLCCDGTWNTPDAVQDGTPCPTNVVKMARAVSPRDGHGTPQVVHYDEGVGTGGRLDRLVGGATGRGLMRNVGEAYRFLVWNFEPGDEIHVFGFSRGAYTARSVAGLVRKCGVLRKSRNALFETAYRFYRGDVHPAAEEAVRFRAENSHQTRIRFLGVWDTVGALGIPWGPLRALTTRRHRFHDVQLSSSVDHAAHALAIDERRKHFAPTLWKRSGRADQVVEQAWFPGAHSNVGGGYPDAGLSDVAFLWMAERARAAGLALDEEYLKEVRPDPHAALVESRRGFYRLVPPLSRPIGDPELQPQTVHASALARHADPSAKYAPDNLVRHLGRLPP